MTNVLNFLVEWHGAENESLAHLLDKSEKHYRPIPNALDAHLISTRKKSDIAQVIALWMGYPGVPESIRNNPVFIAMLAVTSLALISPRDFRLIPDSAGEVINVFEMRGFHRVISRKKLAKLLGDSKTAEDGVNYLLERGLVTADGGDLRLLEIALTNVKIKFT